MIMTTPKQNKINTYPAEITRIVYASIHNEESLRDVNRRTEVYKDSIITDHQFDKVCKIQCWTQPVAKLLISLAFGLKFQKYFLESILRLYESLSLIWIFLA